MLSDAKTIFDAVEPDAKTGLIRLRDMIYATAEADPRIAPIAETLKWGQPAYVSKTGTTLRLGVPKSGGFGLFVHCQSRVIPDYQAMFPDLDRFDGTRGLLFSSPNEIDETRHTWLIQRALTYRLKP